MRKRAHITISGKVQGVYYRYHTRETARRLGLTGTVANRPDGTVQVVCEGREEDIGRLKAWCATGPAGALVTDVVVTWEPYSGEYQDFSIIY